MTTFAGDRFFAGFQEQKWSRNGTCGTSFAPIVLQADAPKAHHAHSPRVDKGRIWAKSARSEAIIRVFAFVLAIATPWCAEAAATAGGVALDASADCSRGDLDLTLTTAGASRESWLATNAAGATLVQGEGATSLGNFDGTFNDFRIGPTGFLVAQPGNTLIGSYAYVGETPPSPANTAEFFVYYNCTTRKVLYACSGAYGTCPQTAQAAAVLVPSGIPTSSPVALMLTVLLVAAVGGVTLSRRIPASR